MSRNQPAVEMGWPLTSNVQVPCGSLASETPHTGAVFCCPALTSMQQSKSEPLLELEELKELSRLPEELLLSSEETLESEDAPELNEELLLEELSALELDELLEVPSTTSKSQGVVVHP